MVRWAILGTGFISETVVAAVQASGGSRVELIVGRSSERCGRFQAKFGVPQQSTDLDVALANPDIDIVYIGLPSHLHRTVAEKAAASGKAVLCEKPLTTMIKDAEALIFYLRTKPTFFAEGLMYLAHPLYGRLLDILTDGRLGRVRSVNGYYAADISRFVNPLGKGTIFNLGCYPVSLLHLVVQTMCGDDAFGRRRMQAFGTQSDGNRSDGICNISDAVISVQFNNGVLASLQSSDSYGLGHGFTILGDKGSLRFVTNPWLPAAGTNHVQWQPYDGSIEDIFIEDDHDAFYHQIKMVETALASGKKELDRPSPRHQDSLEIMSFLTQWEDACR